MLDSETLKRETAIRRYERARLNMEKYGYPVGPGILTDYLNTMRLARKFASGLHDTVIIVSKSRTTTAAVKLFTDGLDLHPETSMTVPTVEYRR